MAQIIFKNFLITSKSSLDKLFSDIKNLKTWTNTEVVFENLVVSIEDKKPKNKG